MQPQFDKKIDFSTQIAAFKVYLKEKDGKKYFMGELNKKMAVTIHKRTGQYAKPGEWQVYISPINYTKIEQTEKLEEPDNFGEPI